MIKQPWLSVIIPTYNGELYLPFALDSIAIQEDPDIECIAVDDGSTDATISILNAYQGILPIKILRRKRLGNWVANTNYALSIARGEYACFLHQDDLWFKNRLSTMRQLINQFPKVGFFLHSSSFVDVDGNYLGSWGCPLPIFPETIKPEIMMEKLLVQNFISIPAPIFKRDIALKVGKLDEALWYTADWDLWLKISACSDTLYCSKSLSGFRIHLDSQTITRSSYLQDFRAQLESVADKHLTLWDAPESCKKKIRRIAAFSIEVNTTFANAFHKKKPNFRTLLISFFLLGPSGWHNYLQNSRIWERVSARLKARLKNRLKKKT